MKTLDDFINDLFTVRGALAKMLGDRNNYPEDTNNNGWGIHLQHAWSEVSDAIIIMTKAQEKVMTKMHGETARQKTETHSPN